MSQSKPTLELSTASLYGAALSAVSLPPHPSSSCPLIPPPASIPRFKIIPQTRFVVDGFKYADSNFTASYFLTHFHSDHFAGLTPKWVKGIIYCSHTTADLLHQVLGIQKPFINALPLSQSVVIDGAQVWLVDANHCPGAVQFLFKVPFTEGGTGSSVSKVAKYVHTGDFRYCDEMKNNGVISEFIGAEAVFLDTTYCNPKFVFPSQDESIDYIVSVIRRFIKAEDEGKHAKNILFLVATYVVGKEKILMEIARRCERKIHVCGRKMSVLRTLGLWVSGVFTEDELETDVHVVGWNVLGETWPYFRPNFLKMEEIMREKDYSRVVGFVPTGWTYEIKRNKFSVRVKDSFEIHLVPYSEHSSYNELREYVKFLKPKHVVPTVGSDVEKIDSKQAKAMLKHFTGLVDEIAIKKDFLTGFRRSEACGIDVEKGLPFVSENIPDPEDVISSVSKSSSNGVEPESLFPQQNPASCVSIYMKENDVERSLQELRECLPNWVTHCQLLDLLGGSGGNAVEAVSKFYEHETEFREQVLPSTSFASLSENQHSTLSESHFLKSINSHEVLPLSQSLKLSSFGTPKKSEISPAKRKKNKGSKRARVASVRNSMGPSQQSITKFFNKRAPPV